MNRHIREQHGHEGIKKVFQCAQCEDSFSRKEHLNQHFASNHEEKTCLVCEARLPDKKELRLHMRTVHKEEKTYDCNMCDANFSGKSHLIPDWGSNILGKIELDQISHRTKNIFWDEVLQVPYHSVPRTNLIKLRVPEKRLPQQESSHHRGSKNH